MVFGLLPKRSPRRRKCSAGVLSNAPTEIAEHRDIAHCRMGDFLLETARIRSHSLLRNGSGGKDNGVFAFYKIYLLVGKLREITGTLLSLRNLPLCLSVRDGCARKQWIFFKRMRRGRDACLSGFRGKRFRRSPCFRYCLQTNAGQHVPVALFAWLRPMWIDAAGIDGPGTRRYAGPWS